MKIGIVHRSPQQEDGESMSVEQECRLLHKSGCQVSKLGNPVSWKRMNQWLDDEAPDLVHIHNWHFFASRPMIRAAKRKGIPVVLTLHSFRFSFVQNFWLSVTLWLHRAYETWKGAHRYIVLTTGARDIFLSSGVADMDRPASERQKHFLYIGRLSAEKGLLTLLKAFALSPYRLVILGDGPLLPSVHEYAEHFSNIEYRGPADPAIIPGECASCAALVFPSIRCQANPPTIIGALACGTAVIASRTGVIKDMIIPGINGLHFEPGDAYDLCRRLEQWQGLSREERLAYGERARESYLLRYTPEKNISELLAIYRSVLEGHTEKDPGPGEAEAVYPEMIGIH